VRAPHRALAASTGHPAATGDALPDLADARRQDQAKRALTIAATIAHSLLLM
jgi:predicted ATPase with chaperone activity